MKHSVNSRLITFFLTPPLPCPYLSGKEERRLVTELCGHTSSLLHNKLSNVGFRRSHNLVYTPACPNCSACLSVRTVVNEFRPSNSHRRVLKLNNKITAEECLARATPERYELFALYQKSRHTDGDMANMNYFDFQALLEETPVDTSLVDFFDGDKLVAGCIVDVMRDGLSAVYSYFHPDYRKNSLGTYIILWLIEKARQYKLTYVYLGYWVKGCNKMAYKDKFPPLEYYTPNEWKKLNSKDLEHMPLNIAN